MTLKSTLHTICILCGFPELYYHIYIHINICIITFFSCAHGLFLHFLIHKKDKIVDYSMGNFYIPFI